MRALTLLFVSLLLTGCIGTKAERFSIAPIESSTTVRTSARTISVTKVNLPSYAKETGIFVQNEAGALVPVPKADWADDTERAMTLSLVRSLADISGAKVASDPWPLGGVPEAEVRVDVEQMLVDRSATLRMSGQFSIRRDRAVRRSRIKQFDININAASARPSDIVDAHGKAWQELAGIIAKAL